MTARTTLPPATVTIHADGRAIQVPAGISVAAALLELRVMAFRHSVAGESRGPLCGMGTCYECRVTINGGPHQRACMVLCKADMEVQTGG